MGGFGYGFGAGFLGGLNKNIERDRSLGLKQAELMGEIQGLQGELPPEERSDIPLTTQPRSRLTSILSAFGLGGDRTQDIEQQITQRAALATRAKGYQRKIAEYKGIVEQIQKGELDLTPEQETELIRGAPKVLQLTLPAAIRKARMTRAARARFTGGITDPTQQAAVEAFGEKALPYVLEKPREDPRFRIQPGPGSPAKSVNERTGEITTYPGTERPSPSADPVMTEYRRLRNDLMRNRLTGVESPAQRQQTLQRLINLALTLKKNADPGSPEEARYDGDLRRYLSEMNQIQAGRKAAPTTPTPTPTPKPGGGGLPPGWKFAD